MAKKKIDIIYVQSFLLLLPNLNVKILSYIGGASL